MDDVDSVVDEGRRCVLVSGPFALLVQGFLASVVVCTLYVKWVFEEPRRARQIWVFDSVKQAAGAGTGHVLNILIALSLARLAEGAKNECAWYALNHTVDTLLGVPLSYLLLQAYQQTIGYDQPRTGEYYDESTLRVNTTLWLRQVGVWVSVVVLTKLLLALPLWALDGPLSTLGANLFTPLNLYPRFELVLVMVLWPALCNSLQFCIIDGFLKRQSFVEVADAGMYIDEGELLAPTEEEPLFGARSAIS